MIKTPTKRATKRNTKKITMNFRIVGVNHEVKTDDVLKGLRELKISWKQVRTRVMADFSYQNQTYHKIFNIIQFRRILINDIARQVNAKLINNALGIKPVTKNG